ncbi:helix-turn-helix domain-containing protein [Hymenobacter sp. BT683]|uniref:Helix-turn-helix domain-containing protein n=1 Tax=Hymenobacter jeongseonensis TaxID=2791027 RepID=A0ABS0IJ35_9BACT|nr:helix-turn-helix domain-containing protein [Hymenobacter jeongseonensis]MBF9238389.1 helix-turn-helix domain-containing protein [Hymenobacter jeongseonensis]
MSNLIILADSPEAFREFLRDTFAEIMAPGAPKVDGPDSLLTKTEACREFGISLTTLTEWQKNGIVPFVRLGRRIYFERSKMLEAGRSHTRYQHRK